ncbi:MAG: hypothetical protein NTV52_34140 [Acidobacteria bacterium]|nr:hypothetical protein [Acidobacteriota bacterium]
MALVQFEIDEESENALNALIESFEGDRNAAFKSLLLRHSFDESELGQIEADNHDYLLEMKTRSEAAFAEGRFVTFEQVKRDMGL